jgi:hypothetical protein
LEKIIYQGSAMYQDDDGTFYDIILSHVCFWQREEGSGNGGAEQNWQFVELPWILK